MKANPVFNIQVLRDREWGNDMASWNKTCLTGRTGKEDKKNRTKNQPIRRQLKAKSSVLTWIISFPDWYDTSVSMSSKIPYSCSFLLFKGRLFLRTFALPSTTEIVHNFSLVGLVILKMSYNERGTLILNY